MPCMALCEGHIDCPNCGPESCSRPVVWCGETPQTVLCLGCYKTHAVAGVPAPSEFPADAHEEGLGAYEGGAAVGDNPYVAGTPEHYAWGRGYADGLDAEQWGDDDPFDPDEDGGEPTGSCDECGVNLYGNQQDDGLCDQCAWAAGQG